MSATVIDEFLVELGLDPTKYNKGSADVRKDAQRLRDEVRKNMIETENANKRSRDSFIGLKNEVVGLLAVFGGVSAVKSFVSNIVGSEAEIGRFSDRIGILAEDTNAWQGAIRTLGGESAEATAALSAMFQMQENLRMLGTTGHDQELNRLLGPNARGDIERGPIQMLLALSENRTRLARADQTALMASVGLTSNMISLLQQGRASVDAILSNQKHLNPIRPEDIKAAQDYQNAISTLETTLIGLARPSVTQGLDAINDRLTNGIPLWNKWIDLTNQWSDSLNKNPAFRMGVERIKEALNALDSFFGMKPFFALHPEDRENGGPTPRQQYSGGYPMPDFRNGGKPQAPPAKPMNGVPTSADLAAVARQIPGAKLTSGPRSPGHNWEVGGVANSQHIQTPGHPATAIDFLKRGWTPDEVEAFFRAKGMRVTVIQHDAGSGMHFHVQTNLMAYKKAPNALANARPVAKGARNVTNKNMKGDVHHHTTIGHVTVNTKATDAKGIADDLPGAISKRRITTQANSGLSG